MKNIILSIGLLFSSFLGAQNTGNQTYQPEAERVNNLVHTKLDLKLDFQKQELNGKEWVTLTPHFYPTDSLSLDAQYMLIKQVALVEKNKKTPLKYSYDNSSIKIKLNKTYQKGEEYTLFIEYVAQPSKIPNEGNPAITDTRGLYFINPTGEIPNKPTQAWTQGESNDASAWFPTIDHPNQKTTEEINLTVPNKFVTLSNGSLIAKIDNGNGLRTDQWRQTQKHAPYLFFIGVGDFAVVHDQWKNIPVDYYVEHEYQPYAKEIFGNTPEMISFFSKKFGYEYPWDKYSQMVVRDFVSGAMENTTAVSHMGKAQQKHGQLVDKNEWESTIAHELAHHWFGDLVTTESWANLTVNESFANYSEYLWLEYKYGKDAADAHRLEDVEGYLFGNNFDKDLVRFDYHKTGEMFDAVTYNKGGAILHMLRSYLGDDAFFQSLKYYLHHNEYGKAEAQQLRLAFEHVTGKDLNWFFNQWYYSNGHPKIKVIEEQKEGKTIVNIKQTQDSPLFEFPMSIDVYVNGKPTRYDVWVKKNKLNTFTFPTQQKADLVVVDAKNDLLIEVDESKTIDQYANQYLWAKDEYITRYNAINNLGFNQLNNKNALAALIAALDDPYYELRIKAINTLDIKDEIVQKKILNSLISIAKNDKKTLVKAAALNKIAQIDTHNQYIELFKNALKSDSFAMQSAAINYLISRDKESIVNNAENLDINIIKKSPELLETMIPKWRKENNLSYFPDLTEMAALYAFMPFQKPEMSTAANMAFDWILSTNDLASTQKVSTIYETYYKHMKDSQPEAVPYLQNMAQKALNLKKQTLEQYPNDSLKEQVNILQKTIDYLNK